MHRLKENFFLIKLNRTRITTSKAYKYKTNQLNTKPIERTNFQTSIVNSRDENKISQ